MNSIVWWVIPVLMMVVGFFLFSKSFFHNRKESETQINFDATDTPVIPRDKREPYLEELNDLHETREELASSIDETTLLETEANVDLGVTLENEHANVDALGDTLSSLEHATADIMPVVDQRGEPTEFSGSSSVLDEHLQGQEQQDQIAVLRDSQEVVSVTLLPNGKINFDGQAVIDILASYGLKFGEMNLYHRYVDPAGKGQLLFSVMRYTENNDSLPFDIQTLSDETVDGLTFFTALPHPKAMEAVGAMLSLSGSIGRDLKGTVHSENFTPLTLADKNSLKDYVASYGA